MPKDSKGPLQPQAKGPYDALNQQFFKSFAGPSLQMGTCFNFFFIAKNYQVLMHLFIVQKYCLIIAKLAIAIFMCTIVRDCKKCKVSIIILYNLSQAQHCNSSRSSWFAQRTGLLKLCHRIPTEWTKSNTGNLMR